MAEAVAYIRRSHKDAGGQVSREDQLSAVNALAERHGEAIGEVFIDWGRSGGDADDEDALKHRPRFRAMLRRIEAGDVRLRLVVYGRRRQPRRRDGACAMGLALRRWVAGEDEALDGRAYDQRVVARGV